MEDGIAPNFRSTLLITANMNIMIIFAVCHNQIKLGESSELMMQVISQRSHQAFAHCFP